MNGTYPSQLLKPLSEYSLAEESEHAQMQGTRRLTTCLHHSCSVFLHRLSSGSPAPATIKSPAACVPEGHLPARQSLGQRVRRQLVEETPGSQQSPSGSAAAREPRLWLEPSPGAPVFRYGSVVNSWDLGFQQLPRRP